MSMMHVFSEHKIFVFLSVCIFILTWYVFKHVSAIWPRFILVPLSLFMIFAYIGFSMEGSAQKQTAKTGADSIPVSEGERQQQITQSPVFGFFAYLFNDTGVSNPVNALRKGIEKKFSPNTYFEGDLLVAATYIADKNIQELSQVLSDKPELSTTYNANGFGLLEYSALVLDEGCISLLIQKGANPNHLFTEISGPYSGSHTALSFLLSNYGTMGSAHPDEGQVIRIIDIFVNGGVNLNLPWTTEYQPVVHELTMDWEEPLLKHIVSKGADINIKGFKGETLLYTELSLLPKIERIEFLLELGADPNISADDGSSPMSVFCDEVAQIRSRGQSNESWEKRMKSIYLLLIEKGASPACQI